MATNTNKYGFKKPGQDEFYNIDDQNSNWDKAEESLKNIESNISNIKVPVASVNTKTGDITLNAADIKTSNGSTVESQLAETAKQADIALYNINGIVNKAVSTLTLYIDPISGNDNNTLTNYAYFKTLQGLFDKLPKIIDQDIIISFATGNYGTAKVGTEHVFKSLSFNKIQSGNVVNFENLDIANFKGRFALMLVNVTNTLSLINCNYVDINTINTKQIYISLNTKAIIQNCTINNTDGAGIEARDIGTSVLSTNNTGVNKTGLIARDGALILKNGTQPTGTTGNEFIQDRGEIR